MDGSATFDFGSEPGEGDCVIGVRGDLDAHGLSRLRQTLRDAMTGRDDEVILNLADVGFYNASALAVVLAEARKHGLAAGVRLVLQARPETLRGLLPMPGMDLMLPVVPAIPGRADRPRRPFPTR
jgi:anti-anti-sigma factor